MKESFYNIKFQHNGLNFIYNTKNSKLITFDNYDNLFANHYSDLVSNGFLVADDFNEFEEVVNKRSEYLSKEKDYKRFTILPTTKCNANCSFCYELAGIITKCQMCPDDELNKIGDIYSGIDFSSKNYNIWCNTLYFDKCQKCKLYPMCLSGCIGQKYIYNENTCCKEKFYLDELLKTAVDMLDEDKQLIKNRVLSLKR